jgi:hypothetical protein
MSRDTKCMSGDQRQVGARIEPCERERHALGQDCQHRSKQAGSKANQEHEPLWLIGKEYTGKLHPEEEAQERHAKPKQFPPKYEQDQT